MSNDNIDEILIAVFEKGYDTGGDIVLERQFENDSPAYERYRNRSIKRAKAAIQALLDEQERRLTVKHAAIQSSLDQEIMSLKAQLKELDNG